MCDARLYCFLRNNAQHRRQLIYSVMECYSGTCILICRMLFCINTPVTNYRGADKSLARPGRKHANVSGVNFLRRLALRGKKV